MFVEETSIVHVGDDDVEIPSGYDPLLDNEPYMNKVQLAYFKRILNKWKDDLELQASETVRDLCDDVETRRSSEEGDMMSDEVEILTKLRSRDRQRKLLGKIREALLRIATGTYGYCERSGEPIGIKRLIARPVATFCVEMQRLHEKDEDEREDAEYMHKVLEFESEYEN